MYSDGSNSRTAEAGKTPPVIGTVICLPVRSSMIVMVSDTEIVPLYVGPVVRVGRRLEACSSAMQVNQLRGQTRYLQGEVRDFFPVQKAQSGVLSCFLPRKASRLSTRASRAEQMADRVLAGSITPST